MIDVDITTTFLGNTDTPSSYAGAGGYMAVVNVEETGIEFVERFDSNIMNSNLVADADRSQNLNGKKLELINGKQFKIEVDIAPPTGEASIDETGYGITGGDLIKRLRNSAGQVVYEAYGNRSQYHYGNTYAYGQFYSESIANPFFVSPRIDLSSQHIYTSRGEAGQSISHHKFTSHDLVTTSGANMMEVLNYTNSLFKITKDGYIVCPVMPISSIGLPPGALYSDGGTIKIT